MQIFTIEGIEFVNKLLWTGVILLLLAILGVSVVNYRNNTKVYTYIYEEVGKTKDGKSLSRSLLLDQLLAERFAQPTDKIDGPK